jgi:hypothetical protein
VEVGEVRVGVVDARQEADLAAVVEALDAAADALGQRRVDAEAGPAQLRGVADLQLWSQVGVAAVVVQRHERVEQVKPARHEHRDEHGRVGRRRGVGGRRLEHALDRHRVGEVERHPAADAPAQHLATRERAHPLAGAMEVVAGAMGVHQWT